MVKANLQTCWATARPLTIAWKRQHQLLSMIAVATIIRTMNMSTKSIGSM